MSKHDGVTKPETTRLPFVVEQYVPRNLTFSPIKYARYATLSEAIDFAKEHPRVLMHVVEFSEDGRPNVVWESE